MTDPSAAGSDVPWTRRAGHEDLLDETSPAGIARLTINRPEAEEAFLQKRKPDVSRFKRCP